MQAKTIRHAPNNLVHISTALRFFPLQTRSSRKPSLGHSASSKVSDLASSSLDCASAFAQAPHPLGSLHSRSLEDLLAMTIFSENHPSSPSLLLQRLTPNFNSSLIQLAKSESLLEPRHNDLDRYARYERNRFEAILNSRPTAEADQKLLLTILASIRSR